MADARVGQRGTLSRILALRANRRAICVSETCGDIVARCSDAWNFYANDIATQRSIPAREYAKAVKVQGRWYSGAAVRDRAGMRAAIRGPPGTAPPLPGISMMFPPGGRRGCFLSTR